MKIFIWSIFFIIILIAGLPKTNIYYFIEHKIIDKNIKIINETIDDNLFSFSLASLDILYNKINVAQVGKISIFPYFLSNSIEIQGVVISDLLNDTIPSNIQNIKIVYSLLNPLNIELYAEGDFGVVQGDIGIFTQLLTAKIEINDRFKNRYLQLLGNKNIVKTEMGYIYEYQF